MNVDSQMSVGRRGLHFMIVACCWFVLFHLPNAEMEMEMGKIFKCHPVSRSQRSIYTSCKRKKERKKLFL